MYASVTPIQFSVPTTHLNTMKLQTHFLEIPFVKQVEESQMNILDSFLIERVEYHVVPDGSDGSETKRLRFFSQSGIVPTLFLVRDRIRIENTHFLKVQHGSKEFLLSKYLKTNVVSLVSVETTYIEVLVNMENIPDEGHDDDSLIQVPDIVGSPFVMNLNLQINYVFSIKTVLDPN